MKEVTSYKNNDTIKIEKNYKYNWLYLFECN